MSDQTTQDQAQQQSQVPPIQQIPGQQSSGQTVSSPHKEMAPLTGLAEVMRPTEQAPEIPPEIADVVEQSPDVEKPVIPHVVKQAGVTHAKENTVHHVVPHGTVTLPQMTQQQAVLVKKKSSVTDAAKWLAVFVLRQFDKIAYQKLSTKS